MLILDFDGVVADTAVESMFVALLAFNNNDSLSETCQKAFLENRYLVNDPHGFKILLDIIKSTNHASNLDKVKSTFQQRDKELPAEEKQRLKVKFFQSRERMKSGLSEDEWMRAMPSFRFIEQINLPPEQIIILSVKDEKTISCWLDYNRIKVNKIYGSNALEAHENKFDFIRQFQETYQINKLIFIDDNIENIEGFPWKTINCQALIASWGYNQRQDNNIVELLEQLNQNYNSKI